MDPEKPVDVEFFVSELEEISSTNDRRYESLSNRVADLEKKTHGATDEIFDTRMIGLMVFLTLAPIVLQIVGDLIHTWRSSQSSQ